MPDNPAHLRIDYFRLEPSMQTIELSTFLFHFGQNIRKDRKYCFIFGSGASRPSGIPTGGELVEEWMKELQDMFGPELDPWMEANQISKEYPAQDYSKIYEKRFSLDPREGPAFLESLMEGKEPSAGYSVLAQILEMGQHRIVITTNFDSLTEDALFIYTKKKPLVVGHEALARFIEPIGSRPIIVKIHRDLLFGPKNSQEDTKRLESGFAKHLEGVFKYYTPLVIGYGGNDGSLMDYLKELPAIEGGIFWFYRNKAELTPRIQELIEQHGGWAVQIPGFDDLLIQMGDRLKLESPDERIVQIAEERAKNYRRQIEEIASRSDTLPDTKEAATSMASREEKDWWVYELLAQAETDPDKKEAIYLEGIHACPDSAELIGNYAVFLHNTRKDFDKAEPYYKRAIELKPDDAQHTGNYAVFLSKARKDYEKSEKYYKISRSLDPNDPNHTGNYALFLTQIKRDYEKAERYFKRALELDNTISRLSLAYAIFLRTIRRDYEKADTFYRKALELEPDNIQNLTNYANYLRDIQKNFNKAEAYYRKALDLDPKNPTNIVNYAKFLNKVRQDYSKAEKYYLKAIELDPNEGNFLALYANFLRQSTERYDLAEEYFRKAIELDPKNSMATGNYANFLMDIRRDYEKAEEYFKLTNKYDPNDANDIGNYAKLKILQERNQEAKELIEKALQLNIENRQDLILELWFYRYAIFFGDYPEAREKIQELLDQGIRSPGWDLSGVVARAKKLEHPDYQDLCDLEKQISSLD